MNTRPIITPREFQDICDRAVLALDFQDWNANALPNDLAGALITEVHKGVCQSGCNFRKRQLLTFLPERLIRKCGGQESGL